MADNIGGEGEGAIWGGVGKKPSRTSRTSRGSRASSGESMMGSFTGMAGVPLTKEEMNRMRLARTAKVAKIMAKLGMSIPDYVHAADARPKLWQQSETASQSPSIKKLRKGLKNRQEKMKIFHTDPKFDDYFYTPKGPEYRRVPNIIDSIMGCKEEVVGREVIHKTALKEHRDLHGVWSELGKPYICLGVPNVNIRHHPPMPATPYGVDGIAKLANLDYFPIPPITAEERQQLAAAAVQSKMPPSRKKRELILKHGREELEMDRMLQKMGLLFFHDSDHVKFPRAPLVECAKIANLVKQGGNYIEEVHVGMMRSRARKQSRQPLEGEQYILGADGKPVALYVDEPPPPEPKPAPAGDNETKQYPPRDVSLVFGWKKKMLELRLHLEQELEDQIAFREDRREKLHASSIFSSEVQREVYNLLSHNVGHSAPDTRAVWKKAFDRHIARQVPHTSPWESKVFSINRFYDRVCTFTEHLPIADPLLDVLIFFLKEWLERGGRMRRSLLEHLITCLARLPDDIMILGRMSCVVPVLQFICKELHVTTAQFRKIVKDKKLDKCHLGPY